MTDLLQFDNPELAKKMVSAIHVRARQLGRVQIMEVCGTHTMEIGRLGLRSVLPENVSLLSGPGCPVCVTPGAYIDAAVELAQNHGVRLATFGDMVRVPGNTTSLEQARANGACIDIVTSPLQACQIASQTRDQVVFLAVGFETTIPTTALAIHMAQRQGLNGLSFLVSHRTVCPALQALVDDPELRISAFLLPGHVSTIIGVEPYRLLLPYGIPGAIAGFAPLDILAGILDNLEMLASGRCEIHNTYRRVVPTAGNPQAREIIAEVFAPVDADWRGIGILPESGLQIRPHYRHFDAQVRFGVEMKAAPMPAGCRCGEVLRGRIPPDRCPLFRQRCTPQNPVGPCMVSSEGSCAAYFKYKAE